MPSDILRVYIYRRTHELLINDEHVEHGVAVRVLLVGICASGEYQPVAFFLAQAGCEAQWILAPVHVTVYMR